MDAERVLAVLAERGPVRCQEVVTALGEDPKVARHVERVRHRLKNLVAAGRVVQPQSGRLDRALIRHVDATAD